MITQSFEIEHQHWVYHDPAFQNIAVIDLEQDGKDELLIIDSDLSGSIWKLNDSLQLIRAQQSFSISESLNSQTGFDYFFEGEFNVDNTGDILVYNISFERGRLQELIDQFPKYREELQSIILRLKDLMIPFQNKWYYTPEMKGRYSIKNVLPALVPDLTYDTLNIQEGGMASSSFLSMVNNTFNGDEFKLREDLKEYCKRDTYAMVRILEKLKSLV